MLTTGLAWVPPAIAKTSDMVATYEPTRALRRGTGRRSWPWRKEGPMRSCRTRLAALPRQGAGLLLQLISKLADSLDKRQSRIDLGHL